MHCTEKIATCDSAVCQNGGVCFETPTGNNCTCKAGWIGKYCERSVNVSPTDF